MRNRASRTCEHCRREFQSDGIARYCSKLCANRATAAARAVSNTKHGMKDSPEYRAWVKARQRCFNPNDRCFKYYGARGIAVCAEWDASFEVFLRDMGRRPPGTSLDRINNDGNYEPGNCRWATRVQQARNQRRSADVCCGFCERERLQRTA